LISRDALQDFRFLEDWITDTKIRKLPRNHVKFIHFKVGQLDENQIEPTPEFPLLQFPCGKKTEVKVYFDFFPPSKSIEKDKHTNQTAYPFLLARISSIHASAK
jgi:hypothetical protein